MDALELSDEEGRDGGLVGRRDAGSGEVGGWRSGVGDVEGWEDGAEDCLAEVDVFTCWEGSQWNDV
jgi:hypothetical protein